MDTIEIARLAEDSGLTGAEVEAKLAEGLLYFREHDYIGGTQPDGEWLDSTGTQYVVAGMGYWGKGDTEAEAKANFRRYGGRLTNGYLLLTFKPGSRFMGVGGMGYRWLGERPEEAVVAPRTKR